MVGILPDAARQPLTDSSCLSPRDLVAEKFETMVKLGITSTRMKDFLDLKTLASLFSFSEPSLSEAIRRTFERRQTPMPWETLPTAPTDEFYNDTTKQKQWEAFVSKNKLYIAPITLQEVTEGFQVGSTAREPR